MKKILSKLKDGKGDAAFPTCVIIIVLAACLSLSISVFAIFPRIQDLKSMAIEMVRTAEVAGEIGTSVNTTLSNLSSVTNITPNVEWNVTYISGTNKIQSGTEFTLTLKSTAKLELGGLFSVDIPIKAVASGRGEKVWK